MVRVVQMDFCEIQLTWSLPERVADILDLADMVGNERIGPSGFSSVFGFLLTLPELRERCRQRRSAEGDFDGKSERKPKEMFKLN